MTTTLDDLFPERNIGVFAGMPVVENPWLPFDFVAVDTFTNTIVVGETAHLLWLIRLDAMRRDALAFVDDITRALAESLGIR